MAEKTPEAGSDLSVTALYTAGVWAWAGVENAERFAGDDTRAVFRWVNRVLALARIFRPGLPSLRHSLAHRHQIIDHLVGIDPQQMLVEVGVGLCPRTLTWASRGRRCVEIDLPAMMRARLARLARTQPRGDGAEAALPEDALTSLEGDLLESSTFVDRIDAPATLVVEGVFPYFSREQREVVWASLHTCLRQHGGRLIFDLTPADEQPRPGIVGRALDWVLRRFTRGRSFVAGHRSREEILWALKGAGFSRVEVFEPRKLPPGCRLASSPEATQTVVFDARV